ncbi:MAG TPA: DUF2520 domain-containing protein [Lentimicrobium sp.]|nr:DUF2520 domain-containing protein [Lentimicrobium sp.]
MKAQKKLTLTIAGSGNAGTFLTSILFNSGCQIKQVYSKTYDNALKLAHKVKAQAINQINDFDPDCDLLIIALPDIVIPGFCEELSKIKGFENVSIASVAGSVDLEKITKYFKNAGVLYPVQSFTLNTRPNADNIPICIEASNENTKQLIREVGGMISKDLRYLDSNQRTSLHLAAVFACNFTNHLIAVADEILMQAGIEKDILMPLIHETINRLDTNEAIKMQTGPAIRMDWATLDTHKALLEKYGNKRLKEIYSLLSENIIKFNTGQGDN